MAATLADWLSQVVQAVDPWISSDIEKGARWNPEIAARLETSRVGIVCLTRENLDSRWILFEAGALSKTKDAYVCTLLLDVMPTDVDQPLGQFQHTTRERGDVLDLVRTINKAVERANGRALPPSKLEEVFDVYWPKLEGAFAAIAEQPAPEGGDTNRTDREMLQELLELTRANERRLARLTRPARDLGLRDYFANTRPTRSEAILSARDLAAQWADKHVPESKYSAEQFEEFAKALRLISDSIATKDKPEGS